MNREHHAWYSPSLGRHMDLVVFGHAGEPVIVFPSSCGRFFEWENFGVIESVRHKLDEGRLQLVCLDSVDAESWYNTGVHPAVRIARDDQYDRYLVHEVVPFIAGKNHRPITLAGASFGGYHAVDKGLRHPDVFRKILSLSGAYDMRSFLDGHEDLGTFLHQPFQYLPDLADPWFLDRMRQQTVVLAVGDQDFLLGQNQGLCALLRHKGVDCHLDVWGGYVHDWPAWKGMLGKHAGW
ncbi:MAG: esterase family protein [Polyangiaceae bacterium]|nr:esterase family protein [Polyangiaceae bacterium]